MKSRKREIFINGRFFGRKPTGVDRFASELLLAIDWLYASQSPEIAGLDIKILLPYGTTTTQTYAHLPTVRIGQRVGQLWEQWDLPLAAKGHLLVNLCNTAPILCTRQLTVIHDAATARFPFSYSRLFRLWYGFMMPSIYRRSLSVCTVSNFSRDDLAKIYGCRSDVCVLPEGTDHMDRLLADDRVLEKFSLLRRPYVLAVSSLSPHKNFSAVVQAFELLGVIDFDMVIAGGQNPKVFAQLADNLPRTVRYVGYVTDSELKSLYKNAACFVFPSLYEGYGLPPTEAMACGCPVIAARAASIPEICGDAAVYFDPSDSTTLASALRRVMGDPVLRRQLSERGLAKSATMRWRNAAQSLLQEIRRVTVNLD